jgi:hypothetical protein
MIGLLMIPPMHDAKCLLIWLTLCSRSFLYSHGEDYKGPATATSAQTAEQAQLRYFFLPRLSFAFDVFSEFDESPRGVSPLGAPRTVHEPLDSHGSRCSAVAMT